MCYNSIMKQKNKEIENKTYRVEHALEDYNGNQMYFTVEATSYSQAREKAYDQILNKHYKGFTKQTLEDDESRGTLLIESIQETKVL